MQFNKLYTENFYFFTDNINEQICKNVLKFKNISLVYNQKTSIDLKNFLNIKKFCKIKISNYILWII